ncbi:MAG: type VII toxin-antitoxin system HepT family RNase toxin [Bacillota bacterium]
MKVLSLSVEQVESIMRRLDFMKVEAGDISRFTSMTQAEYMLDRDRRRSLERLVENVVNASIDVVKIVLSAGDLPIPDTYRDLMLQAGMAGFIEGGLAERLAEMTRLRNILAHQYLDIRWVGLRAFVDEAPTLVKEFIRSIEDLLNEAGGSR